MDGSMNTLIMDLKKEMTELLQKAVNNGVPIAACGLILENLLKEADVLTGKMIQQEKQNEMQAAEPEEGEVCSQ
jgi:hypothetical protein